MTLNLAELPIFFGICCLGMLDALKKIMELTVG